MTVVSGVVGFIAAFFLLLDQEEPDPVRRRLGSWRLYAIALIFVFLVRVLVGVIFRA
jgi:hypothetical protein